MIDRTRLTCVYSWCLYFSVCFCIQSGNCVCACVCVLVVLRRMSHSVPDTRHACGDCRRLHPCQYITRTHTHTGGGGSLLCLQAYLCVPCVHVCILCVALFPPIFHSHSHMVPPQGIWEREKGVRWGRIARWSRNDERGSGGWKESW